MTSLSENTVVTTSGGLVELGYTALTSSPAVGPSWTSIASTTVVADGSKLLVEFQSPLVSGAANARLNVNSGTFYRFGDLSSAGPFSQSFAFTPSAGVVTIAIEFFSGGGATVNGSGGTYAAGCAFLRVSKIIQASQFIVPLASAPLVTSLPSAPIDGQEIRYVADATNGVIWNLRYRADSSSSYKWEFIGGPSLVSTVLTEQAIGATAVTYLDLSTVGPQITIPVAGDYRIEWGANAVINTTVSVVSGMGIKFGSASAPADANPGTRWVAHIGQPTASSGATRMGISNFDVATGVAALTLIKAQYYQNNGSTTSFGNRRLSVTPIRVG